MRVLLIIAIAFIFLPLSLKAQGDWDPFKPGLTYYYGQYPNFFHDPFKIDSVTHKDGDTIYYFNRMYYHPVHQMSNNVPKMFQRKCIIRGQEWMFCNPDTFYYKPYAQKGESWIIDSTNMRTATVEDVYVDTIFGISDSMKRIRIHPYDISILSKHHGFVHYYDIANDEEDYKLMGIQELGLGSLPIDFMTAFDFRPGDIFIYKERSYKKDIISNLKRIRRDILQKVVVADTITITVNEVSLSVDMYAIPFDTIREYGIKEIKYINTADHPLNLYDRTLVPSIYANGFYQAIRKVKNVCYLGSAYGYSVYDKVSEELFILTYDKLAWNEWRRGQGVESEGYSCLDSAYRIDIEARVINGDTFGVIPSASQLLGINDFKDHEVQIKVYPNPATDVLHLEGSIEAGSILTIFNLSGKAVLQKELANAVNSYSIKISTLPPGAYVYVLILNHQQMQSGKLLVR